MFTIEMTEYIQYLVLQNDLLQTDILLSGRQDDLLIESMSSVQIQIYMDDLSGDSPNKLVDFHISYLSSHSSHSFLRSSLININIFTSSARMFPSTLECPCTHHPCAHTVTFLQCFRVTSSGGQISSLIFQVYK